MPQLQKFLTQWYWRFLEPWLYLASCRRRKERSGDRLCGPLLQVMGINVFIAGVIGKASNDTRIGDSASTRSPGSFLSVHRHQCQEHWQYVLRLQHVTIAADIHADR